MSGDAGTEEKTGRWQVPVYDARLKSISALELDEKKSWLNLSLLLSASSVAR